MKIGNPFISKSKYLAGLQCSKLLWYYYNAKDEIPEVDAGTQAVFDQGILVGQYAKKLFPDGIEIKTEHQDIYRTIEESQKALIFRKPLFEAGFGYKNAYARADILCPVSKDAWDIIEVKSSTEVKDINLDDVALQRFVYEGAGLKIKKCWIYYINNKYVRQGKLEPEKLFAKQDITQEVAEHQQKIEEKLKEMALVIGLKKCPDIRIGPHCSNPYDCALIEQCWAFLPEHNIFTLTMIQKKKCFKLLEENITAIKELPSNFHLSERQKIQVKVVEKGNTHIDREKINDFLKRLKYPLYFLDFETLGTAIPVYDLSKPYQQIPFQYSLHVLSSPYAEPEHFEFLASDEQDPRPDILKNLKHLLGEKGSIVAYNTKFEKGRLKESSEAYPEYKAWYKSIIIRFIDLLSPFQRFYYYHPNQCGSASIKEVLPVLTGKNYNDMEIADGGTASAEYLRVTFGDVDSLERQHILEQLKKYCGLDTMGMVWILDKLKEIAS
jgi:hypothetical protein